MIADNLPVVIAYIDAGRVYRFCNRTHGAWFGAAPIHGLRNIDPSRDSLELRLARWAVEEQKPVFGICRGLQAINVALGGSLIQDIPSQHAGALEHDAAGRPAGEIVHPVRVEAESTLARLLGTLSLEVNSSHHQAILQLAPGWQATAHAPDGIVEAIECDSQPFALGVQWHPERLPQRT
ncbi:MAG: gamma-glutamyl-gamma-aminobutyrate hydrolase family protein, partial [Actinobacteria bacterium]|nr:gamma-glutamyl-gamma-aminobutyrate hydrolase family protein [Actinomycetota bacterium]